MKAIFAKMAAADLIVFATPVYVFAMSALLKMFLERLYSTSDVFDLKLTQSGLFFHHVDSAICSKPFALLVCCDNMERETPKNVISYFRTYGKFMDAPQVGLQGKDGRTSAADDEIQRRRRLIGMFRRYRHMHNNR